MVRQKQVYLVAALTLFSFGAGACSKGQLNNINNAEAPSIERIIPSEVLNTGGSQIAIMGSGFAEGSKVTFGTIECERTEILSESSAVCTVPAHTIGQVDVTLTTPKQKKAVLPSGLAFIDAVKAVPGYAVNAGGGVTTGANRRLISSIGELGTPLLQTGANRNAVSSVQGAFVR